MAMVPECVVCLQPYDGTHHVPRVLGCGHSPCELCLAQLRSSWRPPPASLSSDASPAGVVRCPECSHRTRLPAGGHLGLPKNVELLRLLPSLLPNDAVADDAAPEPSSAENGDVAKTSLGKSLEKSLNRLSEKRIGAPRGRGRERRAKRKVGSDRQQNWLLPCDLFSGNSRAAAASEEEEHEEEEGRACVVVVPERAIRPRDGGSSGDFLRGDMELESSGGAAQAVTLLRLETAQTASAAAAAAAAAAYEQAVRSAWESVAAEARAEILVLGRAAALCRRVCPVVGLWMSRRRRLFLVSAVPAHEVGRRWDSRESVTRMARDLCEAVWEMHAQRVVLGLLSPDCIVLDRFGAPLVDFGAALHERRLLYRAAAAAETGAQDASNSSTTMWRCLSPEVLSLLPHATVAAEFELGRKADVWSLGCLVAGLLWGGAPYGGLDLPELFRAPSYEGDGGNPNNFLDLGALESCSSGLKAVLSRCFSRDPAQRPELDELWVELGGLAGSENSSLPEEFADRQPACADRKCWMVSLPGFVQHGRAVAEESQRWWVEICRLDEAGADGGREARPCGLELKNALEGHADVVTSLVVCGDLLLSASFDKTIRVWSLEDYELLHTLAGHTHMIAALTVDADGLRCFSGDSGGTICCWKLGEADSVPLVASWQEHNDWRYTGVTSLVVSADGVLYSGSGDRTIKAWSVQNFELLATIEGHDALISALVMDGDLLYSASWDLSIRVWWRNDHSHVAFLGDCPPAISALGGVRTLCISDGFLFAGRENGAIQVWRDEECVATWKAHDMMVTTLCAEGGYLYTGSWDCLLKVVFSISCRSTKPREDGNRESGSFHGIL